MTCKQKLASFPNTRQRPRKPTQESFTRNYTLPTNGTTGLLDTGAGGFDQTDDSNEGQVTTVGNMLIKAYMQERTYITLRNLGSAQNIRYRYKDATVDGAGFTTGMTLRAGDSVDLESPEMIFVENMDGAEPVEIAIDWGIG